MNDEYETANGQIGDAPPDQSNLVLCSDEFETKVMDVLT